MHKAENVCLKKWKINGKLKQMIQLIQVSGQKLETRW